MAVTDTTLDGWFKERYASAPQDLVPDFSIVAEDVPFGTAAKLGEKFIENVRVRRSQGHTFYGTGLDAFTLNSPVSGQRKPAEIQGTQYVLREQVAYGVIASARNSQDAFGNAFDDIVKDMVNSAGFARELCLLYGGSDIGTMASATGSGTTRDVVISEATWAPGLWAQMEGALVDAYSAAGGTKRNSNDDITITAVDAANRTVSISGNSTDLSGITYSSDVFIPKGADGNWFDGLDVLVPNSGTMHGIDATTYGLWAGNSVAAGSAALTFAKVQQAATEILVRGGMGKLCCYLSPYTWTDLNDDLAGLRRYVNDHGKGEVSYGTKAISYYGVGGEIELKPHPMVKAGEAFLVNPKMLRRVGATDTTFSLGVEGQSERFFRELDDSAAFELRSYWHQALLNKRPACHAKITGIDNDSLS